MEYVWNTGRAEAHSEPMRSGTPSLILYNISRMGGTDTWFEFLVW